MPVPTKPVIRGVLPEEATINWRTYAVIEAIGPLRNRRWPTRGAPPGKSVVVGRVCERRRHRDAGRAAERVADAGFADGEMLMCRRLRRSSAPCRRCGGQDAVIAGVDGVHVPTVARYTGSAGATSPLTSCDSRAHTGRPSPVASMDGTPARLLPVSIGRQPPARHPRGCVVRARRERLAPRAPLQQLANLSCVVNSTLLPRTPRARQTLSSASVQSISVGFPLNHGPQY
jgi:hypothetical protein